MSEETNVQETVKPEAKKSKCCAFLAVGVILTLLVSIANLTITVLNTYGEGGPVNVAGPGAVSISKKYDKGQSLEKAIATKKPMIVFFYTDWCHFCQQFAPTFDKVAKDKQIKKNFAIAYVNCEDPKNREHADAYKIKGFPTVFVVDPNDHTKRTQLENKTFFQGDAIPVIKRDALKAIGK